jgi:hypothetical protein
VVIANGLFRWASSDRGDFKEGGVDSSSLEGNWRYRRTVKTLRQDTLAICVCQTAQTAPRPPKTPGHARRLTELLSMSIRFTGGPGLNDRPQILSFVIYHVYIQRSQMENSAMPVIVDRASRGKRVDQLQCINSWLQTFRE